MKVSLVGLSRSQLIRLVGSSRSVFVSVIYFGFVCDAYLATD